MSAFFGSDGRGISNSNFSFLDYSLTLPSEMKKIRCIKTGNDEKVDNWQVKNPIFER